MNPLDLYETAWSAWASENLDEAQQARLERYLRRERARRRRKELGDALLLASLGLVPRRVRRLD